MNYVCQSCSMPMQQENHFGTNSDGSKNITYCCYCFKNGNFTEPNLTKDEMIKKVSQFMIKEKNVNEEKAIELAKSFLEKLERWKS